MAIDRTRHTETGTVQHCWPEHGVEARDVFADEVIKLGLAVDVPVGIEVVPGCFAPLLETGHVTNRRVQPDIKILTRRIRNFETPVGRIARDVPVLEALIEPFVHLVGDFGLHMPGCEPGFEHVFEVFQLEEILFRILFDRGFPTDDRYWILEVGGVIGSTTVFTVVTILIAGTTVRTLALDKSIRQKHFRYRVISLRNDARSYVSGLFQLGINVLREKPILLGMSAVIIVESDPKIRKVLQVFLVHAFDQCFRGNPFGLRAQHDWCAMSIVGAYVDAFVTAQLLKARPDVGLHVLEHMADMDRAISIGQRAGHQDLAGFGTHRMDWPG